MISVDAIKVILGIKDRAHLNPLDMVKGLKVTFYPYQNKASSDVKSYAIKFRRSLLDIGVDVVDYNNIWEWVPIRKRTYRVFKYLFNNIIYFIRIILHLPSRNFYIPLKFIFELSGPYKIKKGIHIVCVGEQELDQLPMKNITSFKTNSIITILDFPKNINDESNFTDHFDISMGLFAYHMTNIVISVDDTRWMVYNFNASHPIYSISSKNFNNDILHSLIPKIAAPICPHKLNEFDLLSDRFTISNNIDSSIIREVMDGSILFEKTKLYPPGKLIDSLPFRHNFHRLIGKLHLDSRNGMSFGYLAYQMPTKIPNVQLMDNFIGLHPHAFSENDYYIDDSHKIFIKYVVKGREIVLTVPDVWVMTIRSGANKTNFNPKTDLLKMGLINGRMKLQFARESVVDNNYKPSFDSKVILSHAVGNALVAELSQYLSVNKNFSKNLANNGIGIAHWHGYFNPSLLPKGVIVYGRENPHVSCSSPQSAIYALQGKIATIFDRIESIGNYVGDVHIEPQHGINVVYPKLTSLAKYIIDNPGSTELGNKYL